MLFIKVFTQQLFISGKKMAIKAQKNGKPLKFAVYWIITIFRLITCN